jgi:uncharacterized membrane protein
MSTHPPVLVGWILADLTETLGVIATVLVFIGAVGLGVAAFVWARKWRQQLADEPTIEAQIESYRTMLEAGLIDDDEYDRIVAQLRSPGPEPPDPPTPPTPPGTAH